MSELATSPMSDLALRPDQEFWSEKQRAALVQLGVRDASNADLAIFFHVAARTGLDPFARQIYLIGRREKQGDEWTTRQTIQTGIDGYRLIARRAADRAGEKLSESEPLWCGRDLQWLEAWPFDEPPAAAKVIVYRDGEPFAGVAMYREFVQTTRDGRPTSMWARMPGNQLAKCAEAQALRKAYPQELAGIYTDEEMGQADAAVGRGGKVIPAEPTPPVSVDELDPGEDRPATQRQLGAVIGLLRDLGVEDDEHQRAWLAAELGRDVDSRRTLTRGEAAHVHRVISALIAERGQLPEPEDQA